MVLQRPPETQPLGLALPRRMLLTAMATMATIMLAIMPITLAACATSQQAGRKSSATIDSHRSSAFDGGVTRLLVLLGRSDHPDEDQFFLTSIERELRRRRVSTVVATVSEATLDEPQPLQAAELADKRRAVRVLGPEAVMRIRATSVVADAARPQWRTRIVYQVGLYLTSAGAVGERVWRAELEHSGPERGMEKRFTLAAACLMERLDAEGILASSP